MPRYYFHVHDGVDLPDKDGTELPDIRTAQQEAVRYAGELLSFAAGKIAPGENWSMDVTDGRGLLLFRLDFVFAVAPAGEVAMGGPPVL